MFGEWCCEKVCLGGVAVKKKCVRAGVAVSVLHRMIHRTNEGVSNRLMNNASE